MAESTATVAVAARVPLKVADYLKQRAWDEHSTVSKVASQLLTEAYRSEFMTAIASSSGNE